jgi:DNA-binding protein HU-beta
MTSNESAQHLYKEDLVSRIAELSGLSKRQSRRAVNATCLAVAEALSQGNDITLQDLGRFRVARVKSHWKTNLQGKKVAQKMFFRVYFSPSEKVMNRLNKHLHNGGKNAKKQNHTTSR